MSKASTKTLAARGMVAPSLTSTNQSIFHYKTDTEWKDISDETQKQRIEKIMINNIFKKEISKKKLSSNLDDTAIDKYLERLSTDDKTKNEQSINKYEKLYEAVISKRSTNLGEELQSYSGMFEKDCLELFKTNIKDALIKIKDTEHPNPVPTGYKKIHEALQLKDDGAKLKVILNTIQVKKTEQPEIRTTIQNIFGANDKELPQKYLVVLLIIICRANGFIGLTLTKLNVFIKLFDETPAANKDRAKNIFIRLFSFCINDNPSDYNNSKELFRKITKIKEVPEEIIISNSVKEIIIQLMQCRFFTCYQDEMEDHIIAIYKAVLPNNILFDSSLKELIKNNSFIKSILNSNDISENIIKEWCTACRDKISTEPGRATKTIIKINELNNIEKQKLINYFICILIIDKIIKSNNKDNESSKRDILELATTFWNEINPPIKFAEPYISTLAPAPIQAPITAPPPAPIQSPITAPSPAPIQAPITAPPPAPIQSPITAPPPAPIQAPITAPPPAPIQTSRQLPAIKPRQQTTGDQFMAQAPSMFGGAFQNYKFWKKECGTCWICKQPIELLILTKSDNPNTTTDENKLLPIVTNCGEDEHVICMIPGQCCGTLQATPYIVDQTCSTKNIQFQKLLEAGLLPSHVLCNQLKSKKLKIKVSKGLILGKSRLTYQLASSTINDFIKEYDEEKLEGKGGETGKHNKLIQYRAIEEYWNDFDPEDYKDDKCDVKKENIRTNVETHIKTIVDLLNNIDDQEASSTIIQIRFLLRGCFLLINTGLLSNEQSYKGEYDRKPRWQSQYYDGSFGSAIEYGIIFGNIFDTNLKGGAYGGSGITNESSVNNIDDLETFIDKFNEDVGIEIGGDLINLFNVGSSNKDLLQKLYLNDILYSNNVVPTVTSSINNPSDQLLTDIFDGNPPDITMGEASDLNQQLAVKIGEDKNLNTQNPDVNMEEGSDLNSQEPDVEMGESAKSVVPQRSDLIGSPREKRKSSPPVISPRISSNNNDQRQNPQLPNINPLEFNKEDPFSIDYSFAPSPKKQKTATATRPGTSTATAKAGGKRKTRNKKKKRFTSKKRKKTTIKKNRKIRRKKTIKRRIKV